MLKYKVVKRSRLTGYLCIVSFILITASYPLSFIISKFTLVIFIVFGSGLSLLFLPLSIYSAFREKNTYWKWGTPGRWPSQTSPNSPVAPFLSIAYGFLIFIGMTLITILTPTIVHFDRLDILILVIIDILWSFSAGTAIGGGILYDEKKVVMFGKRTEKKIGDR